MKRVTQHPPISKEREKELAKKAKDGDREALEELVLSNMRFAVKVAVEYRGRGVELDDLVGEASVALLEAAKDFDPQQEAKLITFAQYRIKCAIHKALAESKVQIDSVEFERHLKSLKTVDDFVIKWLRVRKAIQHLTREEQSYLMSRYGFFGDPKTLSDIAFEMKKSTECVRQMEKKLLKKIRDVVVAEEEA